MISGQFMIHKTNYFQSLTNWGREDLVTDLIPDEDAIQIVVFYNYVGTDSNTIDWNLDYGDDALTGSTTIATDTAQYATVSSYINQSIHF